MKPAGENLAAILEATLARVVGFVQFAEAKNAAMLAFCSAWIAANSAILTTAELAPTWERGLQLSIVAFAIASFATLVSFLPNTQLRQLLGRAKEDRPNLLFFGDLAGQSSDTLLAKMTEAYSSSDRYLNDLSDQIYANSAIAMQKLRLFRAAAYVSIGAILVASTPALLGLFGGH